MTPERRQMIREVLDGFRDEAVVELPLAVGELRELLALAERQAWQPIETAPKDGTRIIVLYPRFDRGNRTSTPDEYVPMIVSWKEVGWDTGAWMLHEEPAWWMAFPALPDPPKGER